MVACHRIGSIVEFDGANLQNEDLPDHQDPERLNRGIRKLSEKMYLLNVLPSCHLSRLFMF